MNIFENISSAISSVFSNKMRTFLTMIGIIIGVSSVITITALGKSFEKTIESSFDNALNSKATQIMNNWSAELTSRDKIFIDDVYDLKSHSNIKYISGWSETMSTITLKNPEEEEKIKVIGLNTEFATMQKNMFKILYGRVFTDQENNTKAKVCVIDSKMATKIFGRKDVVGEQVNLFIEDKDYKFQVVGVVDENDGMMMGSSVKVPINTLLDIRDTKEIDMIYAEFNDLTIYKRTTNEIKRILASNHNTTDDKYRAMANMEQLKQVEKVIKMFTVFIGFVAGISLLVGGIGVMNIMLVTVTERTREIGIRKSLGATNSNIKVQFLIESMFICALGGIIGIMAGYGISIVLGNLLSTAFSASIGIEMKPPVLSLPVSIGAMLVSTIVGVIFGVYPAGKAAKLDPIQALRYE